MEYQPIKIKRVFDQENGIYVKNVYTTFMSMYDMKGLEKMKNRQKPIKVVKKGLFGEKWINKAIIIDI